MDPIKKRMVRGRKIAQMITLAVVAVVGLTAMIYPEVFRSEMQSPSREELAEANKNKLKKSDKPQRRLSKRDIERLANLRNERARKHMMEILRRLEKRVIIAEKDEVEMTAKFRDRPDTLEKLPGLANKQANAAYEDFQNYYRNITSTDTSKRGELTQLSIHFSTLVYDRGEKKKTLKLVLDEIEKYGESGDEIPSLVIRKLKSAEINIQAYETKNKDMAVRGHATPEDHPLTKAQRRVFDATINPMNMAQLHKLSQELAEYYKNLLGDTEAGKLAEIAKISFPEALNRLAHDGYDKDDMQEELSKSDPESLDDLADMTSSLNEAERSAERALTESGGDVPPKEGEQKNGEGKGKGKPGDGGEEGEAEGNNGKGGGGKGLIYEETVRGAKSSLGQRSREEVLRSLAFQSGLGAAQDMSQKIQVDKEKVLANVIPGRRYSKNSQRKGYLYIDTWHIIGPWNADKSNYGDIRFDKIYPPETKLNLDARYTTGKTSRFYDDERGYGGMGKLSGKLQWEFYQSPTVEVRIPRPQLANDALYFAYTEVYFDQETEMNLAIASDDAARIRVNDQVVFQDTGLSPYVISEQVRKVKFKKGVNKILVRLVNGTGPCRFSLLLLPSSK